MKTVARQWFPGLYFTLIRWRYLARILWFTRGVGARLEFLPRIVRSAFDELRWYVQESWLRVRAVECPLCHWSGSSYRPVLSPAGRGDTAFRAGAVCPGCLSRERHRFSISLMAREFAGSAPGRVLHFAPERPIRRFLEDRTDEKYLSVDLEDNGCQVRMDIRHLALDDESFDFVYCSHVLQAVRGDDADLEALREIHRVMRTGGWGMLMVTEADIPKTIRLDIPDANDAFAVRRYGRDFAERVGSVGFEVEMVEANRAEGLDAKRLGLRPERVYLIRK